MSASFLAACAERSAAQKPLDSDADLKFAPDDDYDYSRHLKPIAADGARAVFIPRVAPAVASGEDAARAEMDDELWAALHEDADVENEEAEEQFLDGLIDSQR